MTALVFLLLAVSSHAQREASPKLRGPYLGLKPPEDIPELFAPGIISADMDLHSCPAFSKDGNLVFWTIMNTPDSDGIYYMERTNDRWAGPQRAHFLHRDDDVPYFPYDDQTLFFISKREYGKTQKTRIWYSQRTNGKWEEPKCFAEFDPKVDLLHWQFTFSTSGNIYFTGIRKDGYGNYDLFVGTKNDKAYSYDILTEPLNSRDSDICPYCAPDESYLIFSSADRKNGSGKGDIYICYKKTNGKWTDPIPMGPKINSPAQEWCPMVTKDGKYLFFLSFRSGKCHPYWVSAKIIEELRPKEK